VPTRLPARAVALLMLFCVVWGVGQVAVKIGNAGFSPLFQAGLRSAGATLLVVAWARASGVRLIPQEPRLGYGALIAVLFAGEFVFLYWGLTFTTVARATLFVYMAPFVVTLGAHWWLPGERLSAPKALGLVCAFTGLVIAFADGLRVPDRREVIGDAMEFLAAVLWGATTLVIKARGAGVSPVTTLFYQLIGSAIVLLALAWVTGEAGATRPTPLVVGALLYQTIVVAFVSYLAWFRMLARYPASQLSAFSFWTPIFAVIASGVLLGEPITAGIAVAVVLIAGGIYLVNRP